VKEDDKSAFGEAQSIFMFVSYKKHQK